MTQIRDMVEADGAWAASLMAERRRDYEAYSPVFWRRNRADGVVEFHGSVLGDVISKPETVAVRCDEGFAIATPWEGGYYVDDFAVGEGTWSQVGSTLLLAIWRAIEQRGEFLRVVTARRDAPKVNMLTDLGLRVAERWWVKPIRNRSEPTQELALEAHPDVRIDRPWVPPVYDPGGPVGIVTGFATAPALAEAVATAELTDLVLLIAPLPSDSPSEAHVEAAGFEVASEFFSGTPRVEREPR